MTHSVPLVSRWVARVSRFCSSRLQPRIRIDLHLRNASFLVIIASRQKDVAPGGSSKRVPSDFMTVLGIETSCDETSAAVVRDSKVISNVTVEQLTHRQHGGVVPEIASRAHMQMLVPIVQQALANSEMDLRTLDGVAAVYGPGLIGSLLVGLSFGKALSMGLGVPFVAVNHMEAHIFSNLIEEPVPSFPFVCLTVSGGHTELVLVKEFFEYELLGATKDDAAGEAFDKVAKMLGLGYPGGSNIDRLAEKGNPRFVDFPRSLLGDGSFDFSFSGLKTSVLYYLRRIPQQPPILENQRLLSDICASFQSAVVDILVGKLMDAAERLDVRYVAVAGGVSANSELRRRAGEESRKRGLQLSIPRLAYCTDNGAMVAMAGYHRRMAGRTSDLEVTAVPNAGIAQLSTEPATSAGLRQ